MSLVTLINNSLVAQAGRMVAAAFALEFALTLFGSSSVALADPAPATAPISYSPTNGLPLLVVPASEVCIGVEFYDLNGDKTTGTLDCSADLTNLVPGNIKSGVTIAGVAGAYPSDAFNLVGATSVADLTTATFDAKIKSAAPFEWFGSNGVHYSGAGDANLNSAANIADGVTIFGITGGASSRPPDAWDLRAGVTVGGVTGKLKVNCRNAVRFSGTGAYNNVTSPASASLTAGDIWDAIDDYYSLPASTNFPSTWSVANNYCGGVEQAPGDDNVWKDVTTKLDLDGITRVASTCAETPTNCTMKDKISGLKWSKLISAGMHSRTGVQACFDLTHNGGPAAGIWRLPTQKELLEAYSHGIASAARTDGNWISLENMQSRFWSATSSYSYYMYPVTLATGAGSGAWIGMEGDATYYKIVCVQ